MSSATMTLIGLYNFDNTIFDNLTFPSGIDKTTAVNEILMRSGEFEILYPDIPFLKLAIEHWGKKHYRTFEKWIEALVIEFDPLYNYDRFEEYTDEKVSQGQQSRAGKGSNNSLLQDEDSHNGSATSQRMDNRSDNRFEEKADITSGSEIGNSVRVNGSDHSEDGKEISTENSISAENSTSTENSISGTGTDSSTVGETEHLVSAYDAGTYQPKEKETNSSGTTGLGDGYAANTNEINKDGYAVNTNETNTDGSSSDASNEITSHDVNTNSEVNSAASSQALSSGSESNVDQDASHDTRKSSGQSESNTEESSSDNRSEQVKHTAHLYGNIGVTTSTQMLEDFLRVERFNIFEQIADIFIDEFCIMVY